MRGFELFDRARDAGAKLLAAERLPAVDASEGVGAAFLIVFDAGRILVSADAANGSLHAMHLEDAEDVPSGMVSGLDEEPWWRVLGCTLVGAEVDADGSCLRLELTPTGAEPRLLTLALEGESVRSSLERRAH